VVIAVVLGCVSREAEPDPPESTIPVPESSATPTPASVSLGLSGRVLSGTDPTNRPGSGDLPFAEGEVMVGDCQQPGRCAAELWSGDGGEEVILSIDERSITVHRSRTTAALSPELRSRWRALDGVLSKCLGDPLSDRPAGDPGSSRRLRFESGRWWWELRMAGDNPCRLSGTLLVDAHRDRVDTRGLFVDGVSWQTGGRDRLGTEPAE